MLSLWNPRITAIWWVGFMREIFGTSVQCCTCLLHKLVQKLKKGTPTPFPKQSHTYTSLHLAQTSLLKFKRQIILQTKSLIITLLSSPQLLLLLFFFFFCWTILKALQYQTIQAVVSNAVWRTAGWKPAQFWNLLGSTHMAQTQIAFFPRHMYKTMYIQDSNYIFSYTPHEIPGMKFCSHAPQVFHHVTWFKSNKPEATIPCYLALRLGFKSSLPSQLQHVSVQSAWKYNIKSSLPNIVPHTVNKFELQRTYKLLLTLFNWCI